MTRPLARCSLLLFLPVFLPLFLLPGACAHTPAATGKESLKPTVEGFLQRVRWRDYASAAQYLAPERREAFDKARRAKQDEKDLTITDFELEEVRVAPDGKSAHVRSRINWIRLPSVSEQSEAVESDFEFRAGRWMLTRQQGGPFHEELSPELKPELEEPAEPRK